LVGERLNTLVEVGGRKARRIDPDRIRILVIVLVIVLIGQTDAEHETRPSAAAHHQQAW